MANVRRVLVLVVAAILAGCSSARYVLLEADGGVIAIPSHSPANREKAVALMESKCPGGYTVEREAEEPVGSTVRTRIREDASLSGDRVTATSRSYTDTEWRITFRCTR